MFHFQNKRSLYVDTTFHPVAPGAGEKKQDRDDDDAAMPPIAEQQQGGGSAKSCPAPTQAVSPTLYRPIPPPKLDGESPFDTDEQKYTLPRLYGPRDGRHCVPARARVHLRRYRPITPAEEEEMQMHAIVLRETDFGIAPATGEDLLVDTHYVRKGRRRRMREGDVVEVGGRLYVALGDATRPAAPIGGGGGGGGAGAGAAPPSLRPTPPTERRRRRRTSMRELAARGIPVRKLLARLRLGRRNHCEECSKSQIAHM